jgi:hypothetical protein
VVVDRATTAAALALLRRQHPRRAVAAAARNWAFCSCSTASCSAATWSSSGLFHGERPRSRSGVIVFNSKAIAADVVIILVVIVFLGHIGLVTTFQTFGRVAF